MGRWQGHDGRETCPNGSPYCDGMDAMRAGNLPCRACFESATAYLFEYFRAQRYWGETDG